MGDDRVLFERLSLEIFQAGLSWLTVLMKRKAFRAAFCGFDPEKVAAFGEADLDRLLSDPAIIRNRRKIEAVVANAQTVLDLQRESGSFAAWIAARHPLSKADWVRLFRRHFRFMGPEVVGEFLLSIGYLPGAHRPDCPVAKRIAELSPPWMNPSPVRR